VNVETSHLDNSPFRKGGAALAAGVFTPNLSLLVSGGHTALYKVAAWDNIKLLCQTADDAVGEAFDKVAKLLGLGYPGGVQIQEIAEKYKLRDIPPFVKGVTPSCRQAADQGVGGFLQFVQNPCKKDGFSYSGLKTAVLNYVTKHSNFDMAQVCASFQHEAIEQLVMRCEIEMKRSGIKTLCVGGGVSANKYLRARLPDAHFPPMEYCTDNAAMIGAAAILGVKLSDN